MQHQYITYNGVTPTTASFVAMTTGITIKTLQQVAPPTTRGIKVIEWGISFDGSAAATPGIVELIDTGTVAATMTAATVPTLWGDPNSPASLCLSATTAQTGYGATAGNEGTITTTRIFDVQHIAPTSQYVKQFPLGREPWVKAGNFLRVRVKFGTAVNAISYIIWEE